MARSDTSPRSQTFAVPRKSGGFRARLCDGGASAQNFLLAESADDRVGGGGGGVLPCTGTADEGGLGATRGALSTGAGVEAGVEPAADDAFGAAFVGVLTVTSGRIFC